jgi:hypothetical protein
MKERRNGEITWEEKEKKWRNNMGRNWNEREG